MQRGVHRTAIPLRPPRCLDGRGLRPARPAGAVGQGNPGRRHVAQAVGTGGGQGAGPEGRAAPRPGRQRRMPASVRPAQAEPLDRGSVSALADAETVAGRPVSPMWRTRSWSTQVPTPPRSDPDGPGSICSAWTAANASPSRSRAYTCLPAPSASSCRARVAGIGFAVATGLCWTRMRNILARLYGEEIALYIPCGDVRSARGTNQDSGGGRLHPDSSWGGLPRGPHQPRANHPRRYRSVPVKGTDGLDDDHVRSGAWQILQAEPTLQSASGPKPQFLNTAPTRRSPGRGPKPRSSGSHGSGIGSGGLCRAVPWCRVPIPVFPAGVWSRTGTVAG